MEKPEEILDKLTLFSFVPEITQRYLFTFNKKSKKGYIIKKKDDWDWDANFGNF